jgi:hypothetical protein
MPNTISSRVYPGDAEKMGAITTHAAKDIKPPVTRLPAITCSSTGIATAIHSTASAGAKECFGHIGGLSAIFRFETPARGFADGLDDPTFQPDSWPAPANN